jgi:PST family polysaccharide transporter
MGGHRIDPGSQDLGKSTRSNDDLTDTAARGLPWIAYARLTIEVVLLGSMVALAHLLPPSAFGIFAVVAIVQELALMMPSEGVGGALVQRREVSREHLQTALALTVIISLAMMAITVSLGVLVVDPLFGSETGILMVATAPSFLIGAVYAIPISLLRRRLDFRRISMIELALNAARSCAMLLFAIAGLGASALVFGGMVGLVVGMVLALCFAPVPFPRWRTDAVRDLMPYSGPATLATVAWTGFRNGDYAVIGSVLGPAQAGFYWRSYQLAVEYQGKIANAMAQVAFPVLARTAGRQEMLLMRQRMVQLLAAVVFPCLVILAIVAPILIPWLFGSDWESSVVPTQILIFGGAATMAINACGSAMMAEGQARSLLGFGIAHFVVYVGVVLGVAHLGIEAVAAAGSIVHALFLGVAYRLLLHGKVESPMRVLWQDLRPAGTACVALAGVALISDRSLTAIGAPAGIEVLAVVLIGAITYLGCLRWWFPATARDVRSLVARVLPDRLKLSRIDSAVSAEA